MLIKNKLYLGSQSKARQRLLKEAQIPYILAQQKFDEYLCMQSQPFEDLLKNIALTKMEHIVLPQGERDEICFALTADTMGHDARGNVHGKPSSRDHAIEQIKALRGHGVVGTAFCLEKKQSVGTAWKTVDRILMCVTTAYVFDMPDRWIDLYLAAVPDYMTISGSITVEGYGAQFLKKIDGSYSTIEGLPMLEVRQALERLEFFNQKSVIKNSCD